MPYTTVDDVQRVIKSLTFSSSSYVTEDDIEKIHIPSADAIIDSVLRKNYTVPITSEEDLPLIRFISMNLAAGLAAGVLWEIETPEGEGNPAVARYNTAMGILKEIDEGKRTLETSRSTFLWSRIEELYEEQDQDDREPLVTLDYEW